MCRNWKQTRREEKEVGGMGNWIGVVAYGEEENGTCGRDYVCTGRLEKAGNEPFVDTKFGL